MPFVQLHLQRGKSKEEIKKLSKTVHASMVQEMNVPHDDYFQVVRQYEKEEFFYDNAFLNINRSDGLVYIHITLKNTRTAEQKKAFYKHLATSINAELGIRKEDVFIVLAGNDNDDWSFGNGQV